MEEQPISVLLVDDDPDACAIFSLVIKHDPLVTLEIAHDAEAALEFLKNHSPDIVVMDIFLPGQDGYQALKQIHKASLAPGCRVIATTAYYNNDTQDEVLRRGFDGYIAKPFKPDEVVPYLYRVLGRDDSE